MPHWKIKLFALLCAAIVGAFNCARAETLVANGGFETGDFTGWTHTGNTNFTGVGCGTSQARHSGNCSAFFGPSGSVGGISQTLATIPGGTYQVSFWLLFDGLMPSEFSASFGGVSLTSLTNPPFSDGFNAFFSFSVIATGANTTLAFNFRDDPGFLGLDDVDVSPTPLPAGLPLFATGVGALGLLGWRRKRKTAAG